MDKTLRGLDFAPIVFASAAKGEAVKEALAAAIELDEQAGARLSTSEVNKLVESIMAKRGPASNKAGKRAKVYYATQLAVRPADAGDVRQRP